MTKKEIIKALATVAPSIHIETVWSHDEDAQWDVHDPEMDQDDYNPWQSEVRASCITGGRMASGNAYLGGTWEKFGDDPEKSNPDISGYFPQMLLEALEELSKDLTIHGDAALQRQIDAATDLINQ